MPGTSRRKHQTICLVDDDDSVRSAFRLLLHTHGFKVLDFSTPAAFLASQDAQRSACLVLDMHMPGMTGLETVEVLRSRGVTKPVIIMTGRDNAQLRTRAQAVGIDVLNKPVEGDIFIGAIDMAIGRSKAN